MKNKTSYTVGIVPKPNNRKIVERGKNDTPKHKYMTIHFPGMTQIPIKNVAEIN